MNPSAANVAIIKNSEGEILVTLRKQEPAKGTLDLPGGFTEIGETSEEGVKREVMEEPQASPSLRSRKRCGVRPSFLSAAPWARSPP